MKSRWSDSDAKSYIDKYAGQPGVNEDVALRVYTSRLIGQDATLVLHGGGNTSVKTTLPDDTGAIVDVLCVKGSGWDLGYIEPAGLPALRMETIGALRDRDSLPDEDMVNAQRTRLIDARSPNPSVETLLHAFLPHKFIDHSHADAILALVDQPNSEEICKAIFGDTLVVVPYIMPGFDLAKAAADAHEANPEAEGLLLLRHGLFTYGDTAKESYERHVEVVDKAERYAADALKVAKVSRVDSADVDFATLGPILRGRLGQGERQYVLALRQNAPIREFLNRTDLGEITQRGTATPDHVIRTKRVPLILELAGLNEAAMVAQVDERMADYRAEYGQYVERESGAKNRNVKTLDADPRVVLVPGLGLITVGTSMKAANVAADVYEHTIGVIEAAEAIGRYEVLPTSDLFDMEYWSLEQAKLGKNAPKVLQGQVVYITGAASGIGEATARAFADKGASLFLTDINAVALKKVADELGARSEAVDASDEAAVLASVEHAVLAFGGLDGCCVECWLWRHKGRWQRSIRRNSRRASS